MKWCLSSRQSGPYLTKAQEIKVKWRDKNVIYDLGQKYPTADIILEMPFNNDEANKDKLLEYRDWANGKLILCLTDLSWVQWCLENNIRYYYGFAVGSFYELQALKKLGVCYVRLAAPAFFKLDTVKHIGIPVRVVPNVAHDAPLLHQDGVCGTWIRPEDIEVYEKYIDAIEFEDCQPQKERALFRIYAEQKRWPGNIDMIITNFNYKGVNRVVLPEFGERRMTCGQKCQSGGKCRFCYLAMDFANIEFLKKLQALRKKEEEK